MGHHRRGKRRKIWLTVFMQSTHSGETHGPGETDGLTVTFWGTRGTRMVTGDQFTRYARKTICAEVRCGNRVIVLDAGSGLVPLGAAMMANGTRQFDLLLTHAHYDHVEGIPFFEPFYDPQFKVSIWSGKLKGIEKTRDIVDGLMKEPYFPIRQEKFLADIRYRDIDDHAAIDLGDGIMVHTTRLHHPGGATGYRIDYKGKRFAFITDTTHATGQRDMELVAFLKDVDAFAYDCSYLDKEFPQFASFGHSTWEEAERLRKAANAGHVFGIHHMPFRDDAALDAISAQIVKDMAHCTVTRDGMQIRL